MAGSSDEREFLQSEPPDWEQPGRTLAVRRPWVLAILPALAVAMLVVGFVAVATSRRTGPVGTSQDYVSAAVDDPVLTYLDKDADGFINPEESEAEPEVAARFVFLDVNSDDKVSLTEEAKNYRSLDVNADGVITLAESHGDAGVSEFFQEWDVDGNGNLTEEELAMQADVPQVYAPPPGAGFPSQPDAVSRDLQNSKSSSVRALQSKLYGKEFRIKNKQSGYYLLAGYWGTDPNDKKVWQFPEHLQFQGTGGTKGYVWKVEGDGRIRNKESGFYLLAGSWGTDANDRKVWQYPERVNSGYGNGKQGFEWKIFNDGRIMNKQSKMYLLAGTWGTDPHDNKVWQYPLGEQKSGRQGFEWIFEPVNGCGAIGKTGSWKPTKYIHAATGESTTMTHGWSKSNTVARSETWQSEMGASITAGFSAGLPMGMGASVEVTVSASHAWGGSLSYEQSRGEQGSTEVSITPTKSGTLWQWQWEISDECAEGNLVTRTFVITDNVQKPPCCPPSQFNNPDVPHGECATTGLCMCAALVCKSFCDSKALKDQYAACPGWKGYCKTGRYKDWMHNNCKKTCGTC